ncbi:MAG: 4Fe-4S binding protein [Candidatus Nealsonbacteria bacterium]
MAVSYKVNKDKCISCGACISICPKGAEWDDDGKSKIKNSEEIEECGGETICPYGAIEKQE